MVLVKIFNKKFVFIGSFLVLVGFFGLRISLSAEPSTWTSDNMPNVKIGQEIITSQYLMPGNRDCFSKNLRTFVYPTVNSKNPVESPLHKCVMINPIGTFAGDYLSPNTGHVYKTNVQNLSHSIVGVPNQPAFFVSRPSPQVFGVNLSLYRDIRSNGTFEDSRVSNGYKGIIYKFKELKPPLKDSANQPLNIFEFAFSDNGKWMIAEVDGIGLVRINLTSLEMTLFSNETFSKGSGISRIITLAISNDGDTAIKSGFNAGETFLYDISACQNTNGFSIHSRSINGCKKKDISAFLLNNARKQPADNIAFLHSVRFSGDDRSINGLVLAGPESGSKPARKIALSLDPIAELPSVSYVGMGDSFASGEGDMDSSFYEPGTDDKGVNMCHLSKRSYPYLIAEDLQITEFHSVACSGSRTQHITESGDFGIQYRRDSPVPFWTTGYKNQLKYVSDKPPSFITISIGGNDLEFLSILRSCLMPGTCDYAKDEDTRAEFAKKVAGQYAQLKSLYENMAGQTKRETKIYIIGYPQFIEKDGDLCDANVRLDEQERLFVHKSVEYANDVIEAAARSAGVHYVDVEDSLKAKNLCGGAPVGQIAVNGVTKGDDILDVPWYAEEAIDGTIQVISGNKIRVDSDLGIGNESFHPNQNGHRLLKQAILSETGGNPANFAVCANTAEKICPDANAKVPGPDENYFGPDATTYVNCLNSSSCGQMVQRTAKEFLSEKLSSDRSAGISLEGLKVDSSARIEIRSVPTHLGDYEVNSEGVLETSITVPDSVTPGYHEVHVIGQNMAGEPVDYYQPMHLTGPDGDINDNNVPDERESCGFVGDSGIDHDKDGLDDACDINIGEPPEDPPELEPRPEESAGNGTIEEVNNQNQNTSLGQSTTGGALQASTVSQPAAGSSGFQQSGGNFAGDITGVGSGLNQSGPSRVLSSSTVRTDEANKAPLKNGNDFPVFGLIALLVGFVFLIWLVQKKVFEEN